MTNKDIWDFVMVCYKTNDYSLLSIFESTKDNYFYCGFYRAGSLVQFKIKISYILTNLWSDDNDGETHSYDIEAWIDSTSLPTELLKKILKPFIRECKLNSIGI